MQVISPNDIKYEVDRWVREFLNAKTGDTITFFQLHNVSPNYALRGIRLPAAKPSPSARFGEARQYEVVSPFVLHVVIWRSGGTDYVLVSSSVSCSDLQGIAEKAD